MNDPSSSPTSPRAFVAAPDPHRYFPAAVMEEARQKISRSVERGEGPALVIGAAGTGKTLLLEVLAEQFRGQRKIVLLPGSQLCSRRALLQMILFQLELPFRGLDEGELRVCLLGTLRPQAAPPCPLLLLVDEADSLPARLLEELRVLTNVADQGALLVSLVLAGSATLEERFAEPKMEVFSQRVSARCYLGALGREETFQYVRAQVAAVGYDPDQLFAPDGLEAMFAATDGIPRLLNQLGDQLLWMAQETGYSPLDGHIVQQAWSELQQLPAPWNTPDPSGSVVEFGELSGDDSLEDDSLEEIFADEMEDEHPASIPIHAPQPHVSTPPEISTIPENSTLETFDATEQLFEQLNQLEDSNQETFSEEAAPPPLSPNPFEESFDTEEVVLDRYLEFEGQLLATAQRVINRVDLDFAQQLSHCEVSTAHAIAPASAPAPPVLAQPEQPAVLSNEPSGHASNAENIPTLNEPGELLVIEDQHRPGVTVVPGNKYRQLFSSLEGNLSLEGNSDCGLRNAE